jgi:protein-S-isoprenylcysteine O-methyltransferase Ste14
MNNNFEDKIGKALMIIVFGIMLYRDLIHFAQIIAHRDAIDLWQLTIVSKLFAILFVSAVVFFTVIRHTPLSSADGILPRVTAVAGTFVMMTLIAMPSGEISREMRIVSSVTVIVGTILSILALRRLGRSFSIMASARELVTDGPYQIIRHPLYGAELITIFGVVLGHGSVFAWIVGAVWLGLQIQRARYEEAVLRASFPEYEAYAARVPMLLPNLMRPLSPEAAAEAAAKAATEQNG